MKTKKFLSMAALALVGAMMTGCSNDDDILQPENKSNVVTLTATVGFDDAASTRAVTGTGVKTFAAGDQMAVIYKQEGGTTAKAVGTLTSGASTKSGTFTFTLTNPDKTQNVTYIYPAAMAGSTDVDYTKLNSQSGGTLTDLGSKYDLATNSGAWDGDNLPSLTLNNQLAILAINLKNSSTDITSTITDMTIKVGSTTYTVSRSAAAGPIYVAIQPVASQNIEVTATDGTDEYVKTLTSKTYAANNGYNVTWNMTKLQKVTWNSTNVFKEANQNDKLDKWHMTPLTYEEITISFSGSGTASKFSPYSPGDGNAVLKCYGSNGDSFTFTAPSGKKFTKIEIIDNYGIAFDAYGDWTLPVDEKIVWRGTPANAVTLGGSNNTFAQELNSIVFTLKDE